MERKILGIFAYILLAALGLTAVFALNGGASYVESGTRLCADMPVRLSMLREPVQTPEARRYYLRLAADCPPITIIPLGAEDFSVFVNGTLCYRYGKEAESRLFAPIPIAGYLEGQGESLLCIEAKASRVNGDRIAIAPAAQVGSLSSLRLTGQALSVGTHLAMLIYALTLYIHKPTEGYILGFAFHIMLCILMVLARSVYLFSIPAIGRLITGLEKYWFTFFLIVLLACTRIQMCASFFGFRRKGIWKHLFSWYGILGISIFFYCIFRVPSPGKSLFKALLPALGLLVPALAYIQGRRDAQVALLGYLGTLVFLTAYGVADLGYMVESVGLLTARTMCVEIFPFSFCLMYCANHRFAAKFSEAERSNQALENLTASLNQRVREQTEALQAQQKKRLGMMTNIFHDLRTPVFILKGCTSQLKGATPEDEENLGLMEERLDFLSGLVEDLFLVAKLEDNKVGLVCDAVELGPLLQGMMEAVAPMARRKDIRLLLTQDPGCRVWGDALRLRQVFQNLLANAIHYTGTGGEIRVSLVKEAAAGEAVITVSDTGKGIPQAELERVFERYYAAGNTNKHSSSGLGLSIAAELVKLHHGAIHAQSRLGEGTSFTVRLPLWEE